MEGKDAKRRFVQSTLFPHKAVSAKEGENSDAGGVGDSGQMRMKMANSKSKSAPRASCKKVKVTDRKRKQHDETDASVPAESNLLLKASQRVQEKGQETPPAAIDFSDGTDEICTPPSPTANSRNTHRKSTPRKMKLRARTTPRKERRNSAPNRNTTNGNRELVCGQIPFEAAVDGQPLLKRTDLRREAKLAAEENARMFSGRPIHPFFMSRKGRKIDQDIADSEIKGWSSEIKRIGTTFNPIHVYENYEDDQTSFDWEQWIFCERSTGGERDCGYQPVYEGSIDSLDFGNYLNCSRSKRLSIHGNCRRGSTPPREVSKELPCKTECSVPIISLVLGDERVAQTGPEKDPGYWSQNDEAIQAGTPLEDNKTERNGHFTGTACGGSIDSELQDELLRERTVSHQHACPSRPVNCLWTDKYQPQNAKQVCGNGESVKLLSEWLLLWHKRGSQASKSCMSEGNIIMQVNDHDYQLSDSDYDTNTDEDDLKNVLLITGPVGSGKSAAIYACARDQGFQIIEINASDWRNGALVKQKFGEAVESHWLQRTAENMTGLDRKSQPELFKVVNEATHCSGNQVIELLDDDSQEAGAWSNLLVSEKNRTSKQQTDIKTLILFEDVDATLCEDHGFLTAIQQLAETAKRPMILTSNSYNPMLPKNLDRSELRFSEPSREELIGLVNMICASEQAKIHPNLVEIFVNHCERDIRKTIMLLQFWCQGQRLGKDYPRNEFHATNSPVLFDLDAAHHIIPKVMCWDNPSKLSELVAEEVVKSSILMEETCSMMNKNRVEDQYDCNMDILTRDCEPDPLEVKKKAMLRLHCSRDEVECAQFEVKSELFDFSCSPVAPTRKKGRRKVNTVLSSDSEDGISGCGISQNSGEVNVYAGVLDTKNFPISDHLYTQINDCSTRLTYLSEIDNSEDLSTHIDGYSTRPTLHSELNNLGHDVVLGTEDYMCRSLDVSLVPESSYVPETELINEEDLHSVTVSYGHFISERGKTLVFEDQDSLPILELGFNSSSSKLLPIQETIRVDSDPSTAWVCQEEVGDSLSKAEAVVPRGFHLLDECSRVDFMKGLKSLNNTKADQAADFVKEAWKKLYDRSNDLKKHVTAEEKIALQGLKLACRMSNLISESDLLLKDCPAPVSDSPELFNIPGDKIHSCCYHENQVEMSSTLAQHGICLYTKEIASLGSCKGSMSTFDLAAEMLSLSANSVALGKLASQDQANIARLDTKTTKDFDLSTSKSDSCLCNILKTLVPPKSHLAAKGYAFHEYASTLSQISRFDTSRLSGCSDNRMQRRNIGAGPIQQLHPLPPPRIAKLS
ncbi:uncharacterized protein LOC127257195 isoform X2 [Andrographis paniculata]|uniref:uncharacterized protein LOC127257195 isoform X2 n=1 Tax=Andrographis paniculata TaxID=175694 RepID=UPI0021E7FD25|nr:uncharacterized protein LOC127257195 isoform X2 [Andrographis paniculata]